VLMNKILICPGERAALAFLCQTMPLVALPMFGENLLGYWMESLANSGVKEVSVLVTDRRELVRSVLGDGSRWGVRIQVQAELSEVSAQEIRDRPDREHRLAGNPEKDVIMLDHLPGLEGMPLFQSYRHWFSALLAWMPQAAMLPRLGVREIRPGVWCGRRSQIAAGARVEPPCWIGDHVQVGPEAIIGPEVILENGVLVDAASEIRGSVVGPDTFVGGLTKFENSIAWGSTLIDWRTGSCTHVPDPFLLCALGQRYLPQPERAGRMWFGQNLFEFLKRPLRTGSSTEVRS